ncbi:MAG: hypothetical protein ACE5KZ_09740 [Candidatus Scalinduaceae bacterium]
MKTYKNILILFTFLLLFTGCSSTNFARISMNDYPPKHESVEIPIFAGDSDTIYERIGVIFVYGEKSLTRELINYRLREQAKKIGADAIIFARYDNIDPYKYFKAYGSAYVDFEWAKKSGSGVWIMRGVPIGAGLVIINKTSKKLR